MKKIYTTPTVEKIEFKYSQQVVAASGNDCWWKNDSYWSHATQSCHQTEHVGTATQVPA